MLLGVGLDARWLVLCPLDGRGFRDTVDGVVSNYDLHTLVAAVLSGHGIAGKAPAQLVAIIEGRADDASAAVEGGTTTRGAPSRTSHQVPTEL